MCWSALFGSIKRRVGGVREIVWCGEVRYQDHGPHHTTVATDMRKCKVGDD